MTFGQINGNSNNFKELLKIKEQSIEADEDAFMKTGVFNSDPFISTLGFGEVSVSFQYGNS